jgi:hypothetical protein
MAFLRPATLVVCLFAAQTTSFVVLPALRSCNGKVPALRTAAASATGSLCSAKATRKGSVSSLMMNANSGSNDGAPSMPAMPAMPKFFSKWDDPNYDPTKDEVDTDVPLQVAAFNGDVGERLPSRLLSVMRTFSVSGGRISVCGCFVFEPYTQTHIRLFLF